jgi:ATP-dependent DNA ligase
MAATSIAKPFHRPGWIYEEKYDGWRMLAYKDGTAVRIVSRAEGRTLSWTALPQRQRAKVSGAPVSLRLKSNRSTKV